jgi:hypothetical protein
VQARDDLGVAGVVALVRPEVEDAHRSRLAEDLVHVQDALH